MGAEIPNSSVPPVEQQAADAVDGSTTAARHRVEQLESANNATLQSLAARGVGITGESVLHLRLYTLVETLLGDMDAPARLVYEEAMQQRFAELLATQGEQAVQQANRARLLEGVRLDPPRHPNGGHPSGQG